MEDKRINKYIFIFGLFIIGSFVGFLHENLLTILKGHFELRQGLIYGPFIPVYGIGLVFFYLIYSKIKIKNMAHEFFIVFLLGFLIGGTTEYITSYLQEIIFGTKSWDYSNLNYDLNGRTSLFHAIFWGIMSLMFYVLLLPYLQKFVYLFEDKKVKIIVIIISIIILFDCIISIIACYRQNERRHNEPPSNQIEILLDKYYPDEYLNKIFNNAKEVKK